MANFSSPQTVKTALANCCIMCELCKVIVEVTLHSCVWVVEMVRLLILKSDDGTPLPVTLVTAKNCLRAWFYICTLCSYKSLCLFQKCYSYIALIMTTWTEVSTQCAMTWHSEHRRSNAMYYQPWKIQPFHFSWTLTENTTLKGRETCEQSSKTN